MKTIFFTQKMATKRYNPWSSCHVNSFTGTNSYTIVTYESSRWGWGGWSQQLGWHTERITNIIKSHGPLQLRCTRWQGTKGGWLPSRAPEPDPSSLPIGLARRLIHLFAFYYLADHRKAQAIWRRVALINWWDQPLWWRMRVHKRWSRLESIFDRPEGIMWVNSNCDSGCDSYEWEDLYTSTRYHFLCFSCFQ